MTVNKYYILVIIRGFTMIFLNGTTHTFQTSTLLKPFYFPVPEKSNTSTKI